MLRLLGTTGLDLHFALWGRYTGVIFVFGDMSEKELRSVLRQLDAV